MFYFYFIFHLRSSCFLAYSSVGEQDDDRLVQFCHGAPSLVMLLAQANLVYGRDDYWQAALEAAEVVWHRGLLAKGLGLCHGNA